MVVEGTDKIALGDKVADGPNLRLAEWLFATICDGSRIRAASLFVEAPLICVIAIEINAIFLSQ